jgi:hypothetical protein
MARGIYEIKLKERFFPALSAADALDMQRSGACCALSEDEVEVRMVVSEDHAMKMVLLAKTMYDLDKFSVKEVRSAVRGVALECGYIDTFEQVAECVIDWVERVCDDMTITETEEWMIG